MRLPHGRVYKDGMVLVGADSRTIADRRRLSFVGMVTVALAVTEKGVLAPILKSNLRASPNAADWRCCSRMLRYDAVLDTFENPAANRSGAIRTRSRKRCAARCGRQLPAMGQEAHLSRPCA